MFPKHTYSCINNEVVGALNLIRSFFVPQRFFSMLSYIQGR